MGDSPQQYFRTTLSYLYKHTRFSLYYLYIVRNLVVQMTDKPLPHPTSAPLIYEIKIEGHLGPQWQKRFGCITITPENNGNTTLVCPVADQAALYGVLKKVRDLGMPLVSVNRVSSSPQHSPDI